MLLAPRRNRVPRTPIGTLVCVVVLIVASAASGCSPALSSGAGGAEREEASASSIPALGEVTPMTDPRSYRGVLDLVLPEPEITPVNTDPQPELPATVTDAQGTSVTVTDTSRILALDIYGTLSQTVFELGLGDSVVGRDISSQFDEIEDRPLVTQNGHELSAEAILALDPTVLLTDTSLGPWDVVLQVRDAGVPVVVTDSRRGLDNLASLTQQVADALGVSDEGVELGERLETDAAATQAEVTRVAPADLTAQLRTIFLYVRGQSGVYYMFGEGSGADSLIAAAGGYDVTSEIGWSGMRPINDEGLISAQPDAIVMMRDGLDSVGGVDGLLERFPALGQTPAGENERIIAMDDSQVLSFGPRASTVLSALAVALYAPDAIRPSR